MFDPASDPIVREFDAANAEVARGQRRLLRAIAEAADLQIWRADGARDLAHWLSMRYGISSWKVRRWIGAAAALGSLPVAAEALVSGELSLDKTVELTRFATSSDERGLVAWAREVSVATVRRRADRAVRPTSDEVAENERARRLEWWWLEDGRHMGLAGELPASQGAIVVRALERTAETIPIVPVRRRVARRDPSGRRPRRDLLGTDRVRPRRRSRNGGAARAGRCDRSARRGRDRVCDASRSVDRGTPRLRRRPQVVVEDHAASRSASDA